MLKLYHNHTNHAGGSASIEPLTYAQAERTMRFHRTFPMYRPTPLCSLSCLAERLGVGKMYVKDESYRFGLNAFKVLGGSHAIGMYLAEQLGTGLEELPYPVLTSEAVRKRLGEVTFISATDGNHGRGIAWTAHALGQHSVILMPKGSAPARLENIRRAGAEASITDLCYDDTVRLAKRLAEENGWVLMQDTSWPGYEVIPLHITQGYLTMALEALQQLDGTRPTHIFVQAGVGSMAASVIGFFSNVFSDRPPVMTVVEPLRADCFFRTAEADDGLLHPVTEEMNTIMAGLACGEPSPIAWEVIRDHADFFLAIPDEAAAQGMRILGNPADSDPRIVSGESGASCFGAVTEILRNPALSSVRAELGLNADSVLLFFSTEGATDPENYRRIVWDGAFPSSR